VFEVTSRGYLLTTLQIMFHSANNLDPAVACFVEDGHIYLPFYLYKSGTSTWKLYGQYNESWGAVYIQRIHGALLSAGGITWTWSMSNYGTTCPTYTIKVYQPGFQYYGATLTTKASIDPGL
jgi:hypothetical protein